MSTEATTLPWKHEPKIETLLIGDENIGQLELPKRYCITVDEEVAWAEIAAAAPTDRGLRENMTLSIKLATLGLRRLNPNQTERETSTYGAPLVRALSDYMINERNGWVALDPDAEASEGNGQSTGKRTSRKSGSTSPKPTGD